MENIVVLANWHDDENGVHQYWMKMKIYNF